MSTVKIDELSQTNNQVDKSVIERMNSAAQSIRSIAEEMRKDAQAVNSNKIINHENK